MKTLSLLLALGALLPLTLLHAAAAPTVPAAEAVTWNVDAVHSSVLFKIKHFNTSWTYGRFNKLSGTIAMPEGQPEAAKVLMEVAADSVDTGDTKRDGHLKSPDFLDAKSFGQIRFQSTAVTKKGNDLVLTGDLTLHGVTKSVSAPITHVGSSNDPKMGARVGYQTVLQIKRSDYGMKTMLEAIGDDVELIISLELTK